MLNINYHAVVCAFLKTCGTRTFDTSCVCSSHKHGQHAIFPISSRSFDLFPVCENSVHVLRRSCCFFFFFFSERRRGRWIMRIAGLGLCHSGSLSCQDRRPDNSVPLFFVGGGYERNETSNHSVGDQAQPIQFKSETRQAGFNVTLVCF